MNAEASAACATASTMPLTIEPPAPLPSMDTNMRIGTTAISCASKMEKLVRPVVVDMRRWLDRISMTMAVEDKDRHEPMITAAAGGTAGERNDAADHGRREDDLKTAQSEHQAAHGEQSLVGQLQSDQEQQKHDAQIGKVGDVLGVDHRHPAQERHLVLERAQRQRSEDRAGAEITQHRAEAEPAHQRHDDAGGAEHDQRVRIGVEIDRRGSHKSLWANAWNY